MGVAFVEVWFIGVLSAPVLPRSGETVYMKLFESDDSNSSWKVTVKDVEYTCNNGVLKPGMSLEIILEDPEPSNTVDETRKRIANEEKIFKSYLLPCMLKQGFEVDEFNVPKL